jgi:hypothetical protein
MRKSRLVSRFRRVVVVAVAIFAFALFAAAPAGATSMLWCGGGFGPTPEIAVQRAIEDAQISASGSGQFTCVLVGEPQVFTAHNEYRGDFFTAQVNMSCS